MQVFTGDPNKLETNGEWGEDYVDMKYTTLYLGICEGNDENDIRNKVSESLGVHPNILTLTGLEPLEESDE